MTMKKTKQKQWIRINEKIELLDTPGVLWPKFENEKVAMNLAITGTIKDDILELTEVAYTLTKFMLENYRNNLLQRYSLDEKQIKRLERAVSGYFDYIEDLVERENTFTMEDFAKSINEFLEFRKYDILKDNGKISRKQAEEKAEKEYNEFNKTQKITSDFDKLLEETKRIKKDK